MTDASTISRALVGGPVGLFRGASYVLRGAWFLLRRPRAWPFAILPLLVNGAVLVGMLTLAWCMHDDVSAWIAGDPSEAADLAGWRRAAGASLDALIWVAAFLLVVFAAVVGAFLVGSVLSGPFQEKLSEVIEELATGKVDDEPFSFRLLAMDAAGAVTSALERLGMFLLIFIPLFAATLIPVVGLVFVVLLFLHSSFFMALQFTDPILARRRIPRMEKIRQGRQVLATWMGFGLALTVLMFVPFLQLVLSPALVTGGTLLWLDVEAAREESAA